jgi:hypothetical protein
MGLHAVVQHTQSCSWAWLRWAWDCMPMHAPCMSTAHLPARSLEPGCHVTCQHKHRDSWVVAHNECVARQAAAEVRVQQLAT